MATYPRDQAKLYTWAKVHAQAWAQDPAAIGVTPATIAQYANIVEDFQAKATAARAARAEAIAATQASANAKRAMRDATSDLVKTIRAFAATNDEDAVLNRALLPAIAAPAPIAPPGQCTGFTIDLNGDGSLTIGWTAKHPAGSDRVVYLVQRRLAGEDAWTLLGASGEKSYTDDTLPQGVAGATYTVTAQRGRVKGEASLPIVVSFGSVVGVGVGVGVGARGAARTILSTVASANRAA